jgi:hypothetical protein
MGGRIGGEKCNGEQWRQKHTQDNMDSRRNGSTLTLRVRSSGTGFKKVLPPISSGTFFRNISRAGEDISFLSFALRAPICDGFGVGCRRFSDSLAAKQKAQGGTTSLGRISC